MKMTDERETILIVDDEEGIRTQIKWAFNNEYNVLIAQNFNEAISNFENNFPNLVTLDISLSNDGDREGIEILETIMKPIIEHQIIFIVVDVDCFC